MRQLVDFFLISSENHCRVSCLKLPPTNPALVRAVLFALAVAHGRNSVEKAAAAAAESLEDRLEGKRLGRSSILDNEHAITCNR